MPSINRAGRVSSIDYESGTYTVTYFDRGRSVTRRINAMSNGEYKMPNIGQVVHICHQSNGTVAAITTGTIWNESNKPAEGYKGLFRKEYASKKGQAFERYDENTGVYTQYIDGKTRRLCNGEIYDEAQGAASLIGKQQVQVVSKEASASIQGKTGVGLVSEKSISAEAGTTVIVTAGETVDIQSDDNTTITVNRDNIIKVGKDGTIEITAKKKVVIKAEEKVEIETPDTYVKGNLTVEGAFTQGGGE